MKALPAVYEGQKYRSRTECRWGIFFDIVEEPCSYEVEALDLGGLTYIPDYFLHTFRAWVEIKGEIIDDKTALLMIEKCERLTSQSKRPVILCFHDPYDPKCAVFSGDKMYSQSRWTICTVCGKLALGVRGDAFSCVWCPRKHDGATPLGFSDLRDARRFLRNAALQAKQHRFGVSKP